MAFKILTSKRKAIHHLVVCPATSKGVNAKNWADSGAMDTVTSMVPEHGKGKHVDDIVPSKQDDMVGQGCPLPNVDTSNLLTVD